MTGTARERPPTAAEPDLIRILHLSDTHLSGEGTLHHGMVDTTAALRRVLDRAASVGRLDLVVASGDLSDDGSEASYRVLRDLLEPWAKARGAAVIYTMGNHDLLAGFRAVLGDVRSVTRVRGLRVVSLDSSVPGAGYGRIGTRQLEWLRAVLSQPAELGSIVVVHHPPVPAETPLLAALELQEPQALLDICAAGGVRVLLCGHYHHPMATRVSGMDVLVAPAVANTSDIIPPKGHEVARVGSGFALIEIRTGAADGAVRFIPVAAPCPQDGTVVFDLPRDQLRELARVAGPPP